MLIHTKTQALTLNPILGEIRYSQMLPWEPSECQPLVAMSHRFHHPLLEPSQRSGEKDEPDLGRVLQWGLQAEIIEFALEHMVLNDVECYYYNVYSSF